MSEGVGDKEQALRLFVWAFTAFNLLNDNATAVVAIPRMPMLWAVAAVLLVEYVWWLGPGVTMRFGSYRDVCATALA